MPAIPEKILSLVQKPARYCGGELNSVVKNKNETMTVTAKNGIQIDQKERTMTAMDEVKVSQEQNTLTAKRAVLYYTDNKNNRVQKIEAFGYVKIDNKKQNT